jgi:MFS family permease
VPADSGAARRRPGVQSDAAPANTFTQSLLLLRTRRFGTFCVASLLANLGTWAQQVAEPWLLLSLGASSFLIGLDSFAMAAPVWLLTLPGGILADVSDRRRIIATCQSIQMLCPTLLVALLLTGTVQPWMVIALSVVVGITDALSMPSFQSIVPSIVERRQIASALALNATQFNLSRILGPALAGLLMASLGAVGCFALNAASYVPFIWVALWILPRGKSPAAAGDGRGNRPLFAGLRDIARTPHLRGALLTVLLTSIFCGPLIVFCPVLVKQALHGDVGDFSVAIGAFGAGGLLGATALLGVDPGRDRRRVSSWFAAGYGLVLALAALNPWFWGLPALLILAGLSMSISNTSANALLQATASPGLRGQTVSLYMLAMRGGVSVGSLATGLSASLLGVRYALLMNGLLAVAAQFAVGRRWVRSPLPKAALQRPRGSADEKQAR